MSQHPVPILRSVAEAYRFALQNWQRCGLAAAPYLAVTLVYITYMAGGTGGNPVIAFFLMVAFTLANLAFITSVLKLAVRGGNGPGLGLQLGADEGRVFIVNILVALLTAIVVVLAGIAALAFISAIAAGVMDRAGIGEEAATEDISIVFDAFGASDWGAVLLVGLGFGLLIAWLSARLALALPATIADGRIRVLSIWPLSNGQALRIMSASLLTSLPVFLAGIALYEVFCLLIGWRPLELAHTVDQSVNGWELIMRANEYGRVNSIVAILSIPLFAGLYAYLYKGLRQMAEDGKG